MDFYDKSMRQMLLYNGALSLTGSLRVKSDTDKLRRLSVVEMRAVAQAVRIFLAVKSSQAPSQTDAIPTLSFLEECRFVAHALANMHVAETTLRFASDLMAAQPYVVEASGIADVMDHNAMAALRVVRAEKDLYSVGFSTAVEEGLTIMLELAYKALPYGGFNATLSQELATDANRLSTVVRAHLVSEDAILSRVVSAGERVSKVYLIALLAVCFAGLAFHAAKAVDSCRAAEEDKRVSRYARQLRASLLRMHAAVGIACLRLLDPTAAATAAATASSQQR